MYENKKEKNGDTKALLFHIDIIILLLVLLYCAVLFTLSSFILLCWRLEQLELNNGDEIMGLSV